MVTHVTHSSSLQYLQELVKLNLIFYHSNGHLAISCDVVAGFGTICCICSTGYTTVEKNITELQTTVGKMWLDLQQMYRDRS